MFTKTKLELEDLVSINTPKQSTMKNFEMFEQLTAQDKL